VKKKEKSESRAGVQNRGTFKNLVKPRERQSKDEVKRNYKIPEISLNKAHAMDVKKHARGNHRSEKQTYW